MTNSAITEYEETTLKKECLRLLQSLPNLSAEKRLEAFDLLVCNTDPDIRGQALYIGASVLSDEHLSAYLCKKSGDNEYSTGVNILKLFVNRAFSIALRLIREANPDIVIQAIQILDHLNDPRSLETLQSVLHHSDINVVHAAIIALGNLGNTRVLPDLLPFLHADSYVKIAAIQSLGKLRSPSAVRSLSGLLTDHLIGSLAAEALARIGGSAAFKSLSEYWLRSDRQLDTENILGYLAHIIEGSERKLPDVAGLRDSIVSYLDDPSNINQTSAARCLLALGPNREDKKALRILSVNYSAHRILPACLIYRSDLIPCLLKSTDIQRIWGFQLLARYPKVTPIPVISDALNALHYYDYDEYLDTVVDALLRIRDSELVPVILDLYLKVPLSSRHHFNPLLRTFKKQIRNLLIDYILDDETRLVLSAFIGIPHSCIILEILDLPQDSRITVISQIADKTILKYLPWDQWLESEPDVYAPIASEVAVKANLKELLPLMRKTLDVYPHPQVISAVSTFRDQESVPILISHLNKASVFRRMLIFESLSNIGGNQAREELKKAAFSPEAKEIRTVYMALSKCATPEDNAFFHNAAKHPDWYVRLACARAMGRHPCPENLAAVAELISDPVSVVSQYALALMKSSWRV